MPCVLYHTTVYQMCRYETMAEVERGGYCSIFFRFPKHVRASLHPNTDSDK